MNTVFPLMLMSAAEHGRAMVASNPAKNMRMRCPQWGDACIVFTQQETIQLILWLVRGHDDGALVHIGVAESAPGAGV
jgi:hypothetical protein